MADSDETIRMRFRTATVRPGLTVAATAVPSSAVAAWKTARRRIAQGMS